MADDRGRRLRPYEPSVRFAARLGSGDGDGVRLRVGASAMLDRSERWLFVPGMKPEMKSTTAPTPLRRPFSSLPVLSVSGVYILVSLYPASFRRSSRVSYVREVPRRCNGTRPGSPLGGARCRDDPRPLGGVEDDEGSSSELLGSVFILCESQAVGVLCDKAVNHWPELSQDHVHVPGSGLASIQSLPV